MKDWPVPEANLVLPLFIITSIIIIIKVYLVAVFSIVIVFFKIVACIILLNQ